MKSLRISTEFCYTSLPLHELHARPLRRDVRAGRRSTIGNRVCAKSVSGVRIPISPPEHHRGSGCAGPVFVSRGIETGGLVAHIARGVARRGARIGCGRERRWTRARCADLRDRTGMLRQFEPSAVLHGFGGNVKNAPPGMFHVKHLSVFREPDTMHYCAWQMPCHPAEGWQSG